MTEDALREELVRLTRTEKKMSLGELADRAKLARSHLSNFINGKRGISPERKAVLESAMRELALEHQDLPALRAYYKQMVLQRVRSLDLRFIFKGMPDEELADVAVERVFVEHKYERIIRGQRKEDLSCSNLDATTKDPVVHILGPAGCGKTTAIRHKALKLLQENDRLPILLPLSALNEMSYGPPVAMRQSTPTLQRTGYRPPSDVLMVP